jgi:hypothetical protein
VAGNERLYGVADASKNETLKMFDLGNKNNKDMMTSIEGVTNSTQSMLEQASTGDLTGALTSLENLAEQSFGITKKGLGAAYENETITSVLTKAAVNTIAKTGVEMVDEFKKYLKGEKSLTDLFKPSPANDIAITADGQHYSLDKGDMLMAVNQNMLASAIGASSPSPILPTAVNNQVAFKEESKTISPKEINVNVNFTHEVSKGVDIDVAQQFTKSLRENTTLQQNLTRTIQETMSNLGLTSV